jgi:hypothetical protein
MACPARGGIRNKTVHNGRPRRVVLSAMEPPLTPAGTLRRGCATTGGRRWSPRRPVRPGRQPGQQPHSRFWGSCPATGQGAGPARLLVYGRRARITTAPGTWPGSVTPSPPKARQR